MTKLARRITITGLALMVAATAIAPALAQASGPDPAQQDFVARALIFMGHLMIDHAHDWAGVLLLSIPLLTKLVGWLMPREWLFAIIRSALSPVAALLWKGGK